VPPTNNLAERALRPEKTRMKTSGCHRSEGGYHNRALIMTVLGTARKQGWNPWETLHWSPGELTARLGANGSQAQSP